MGVFASVLSALFSSSKDLLSKRLAYRMDGIASTYASFAYALPFYLLLLAFLIFQEKEALSFTAEFLLLVFLRSVTDTFAEGMKMHAFAHGDLSLMTIIFSISPLFLLITSPLITRDIPSP